MSKLLFTLQASTTLDMLPRLEREYAYAILMHLAKGGTSGVKLWGQEDLFTKETPRGIRFLYRFSGDDIQVLDIELSNPVSAPSSHLKLAAVVLAGGHDLSRRAPPLEVLADSFLIAGIDNVVIVVNRSYTNARQELKHRNITMVTSAEHNGCLSRSLRSGLRLLPPNTQAVLLSLGSRPFITPNIVASVIRAFKTRASPIVVPAHDQMRGHPVLFDTRFLPELMQARGNMGGRAVLAHHSKELVQIEIADTGVLEKAWIN